MAVKFRNKLTGTIMRVADDRADEYRQLGFPEIVEQSAQESPIIEKPVESVETVEKAEKPKKTTTTRTKKK